MKPRIDYIELMTAVQSHYVVSMLYGLPMMFNVYAEDDGDEEGDVLATVQAREGAFKQLVARIDVFDKHIDEYFQRLLGLDYYKVRNDCIGEHPQDEDEFEDDDESWDDLDDDEDQD